MHEQSTTQQAKMKPSISLVAIIFFLISILFCPNSWALQASSNLPIKDDFLHCLIKHSLHSHPITKAIYTPNNKSYPTVFESYARNLRFLAEKKRFMPSIIVAATHESHVQATVICAKAHGLMLRTRSGGHDMEGLSYVSRKHIPFVLLDMFNLRSINIDMGSETMWVQVGATLGEVYYNIAKTSKTRAFPAGLCPTVGVGGHFSGGGFGTLLRKYGLAIDNIIDAQVVDINGNILDREAMGEDLFWAINGGGGASFGVVLSFKLKLVKVPEKVTVVNVYRTTDQGATKLVHKWQETVVGISEDLFLRLELTPIRKTINATFVGLFLGGIEKLLPLMKKSFPELGLKRENCIEMSWIESALYFYDFPRGTPQEVLLNRAQNDRSYLKSKSDYVKNPISQDELERIWKEMIFLGETEGEVRMQWNPYGGRMSEIPATQTPIPQRNGYLFKIQYLVYWNTKGKERKYVNLSRKFYEFMTPYVTNSPRETFLNYRDLDIGSSPYCNGTYEEAKEYEMKYFNKNFERLVRVKTKVDPDNFFRDEQSIPVLPSTD